MSDPVSDLLAYKGALVGIWLAGLFLAERFWPAAPLPAAVARAPLTRLARNLALAAINFLLSPLVVLPLTALAAGHALAWRPVWWQGWPGLALDLLLLDFLIYWWHRANHRWPLLWRFHLVHHLDRILDSTIGAALSFRRGADLGRGAGRRDPAAGLSVPLDRRLRNPAADRHDLSSLEPAPAAPAGSDPGEPRHHPLDPLGPSSPPPHRHGFQLRHGLQLLGPPVRQPESRHGARRIWRSGSRAPRSWPCPAYCCGRSKADAISSL